MMQTGRVVFNKKRQLKLYKDYLKGYTLFEAKGLSTHDFDRKRRVQFAESLFKQLTTWSALPQ
jgi:hypothetical protein